MTATPLVDAAVDGAGDGTAAGTAAGAAAGAAAAPEAPELLSTQPAAPNRELRPRSPWAAARLAWRRLTSMRTALVLLFLLALAAVPGSVLPQRGLNPIAVTAFYRAHPALAPVLDRLSLFDVFAAPWFGAIYLLLFVSLAGCLVPRLRLHARALGSRPPAAPRHLTRLPSSRSWRGDEDPAAVADRAAELLRGRRFRVDVRREGAGVVSVAAEKGYLRETGNLLFHVALLALLAAIAMGGLFGYKGTVLVQEGDGFANTVAAYDTFHPGRLFSPAQLAPFTLTLERFRASYLPDGSAETFAADVQYVARPGAPARTAEVQVNAPLGVGGAKVYLLGHGYAPHFRVLDPSGRVAFDAAVPFLPQDADFTSTGVIKVPDISPGPEGKPRQLGFAGIFTPSTVRTPLGLASDYPAPRRPVVTLTVWRGDLGLDSGISQSVYGLDTARLTQLRDAQGNPLARALQPGQTWALPGGGSLTFTGFQQWATFQVTHDPGNSTALGAGVAIVLGLLLSLRVRRRRIWLRATPNAADMPTPPPPAALSGAETTPRTAVVSGTDAPTPNGAHSGARPPETGTHTWDGGKPAPRRTVVTVGGLGRTDADVFAEEFEEIVGQLQSAPGGSSQEFDRIVGDAGPVSGRKLTEED